LHAPDDLTEEMQLYAPENFNYLNQSACYTVDGIDDIKEFADTRVRRLFSSAHSF
jgi:myosin heavy subunit